MFLSFLFGSGAVFDVFMVVSCCGGGFEAAQYTYVFLQRAECS